LTDPLWIDPADSRYPILHGTVEADVAIVGGGLTGIGAAYALRDSGADVVLVEERTLASGASGRNAGFVLAGPARPFGRACEQLGFEEAWAVWRLTVENNRLMADLVDEYTIECGFLRRGSMSLAGLDEEMLELLDTVRCLAEVGVDVCVVDRNDLPRPFDRLYEGGVYYPGNAELNPAKFVRAVASVARNRVRIFEQTPVLEIRLGERHTLLTPEGEVQARAVILATNGYTSRLLPNAPIAPIRGQVVGTSPVARVIVPFPMYANFGYQYWRQTIDGRLVVGGWRDLDKASEVGTEEVLHHDIHAALDEFCHAVAGADAVVEYRWSGVMGFTPDALPLVGPIPGVDRMYMAAGYSGHGVSMAFTCGGRVASRAIGAETDLPTSFDPGRFPAGAESVAQPRTS
jgi:glycine/D-amino acid oxidase-like deaminating enzyme